METDLEPLTRLQRKRTDYDQLSTNDKYRMDEFENIASQLRTFIFIDFELDHSSALLNSSTPGSHHPDNLQLLVKSHNRLKSSNNWKRFTIDVVFTIKFFVCRYKINMKNFPSTF